MILSKINLSFRGLLNFTVGSLSLFGFSTLIITSSTYGIHKITPMSYWVEYKSVESTEQMYSVYSTGISMKSNSIWKKDNLAVDWIDTLYCDTGKGFIMVDSKPSSGLMQKSEDTDINGTWMLNIAPPKEEATCYVKSGISVTYGGVTKHQVINSNKFSTTDPLNFSGGM